MWITFENFLTCITFPVRRSTGSINGLDQIPPCVTLHTGFLRLCGLESVLPPNWSPHWMTLFASIPLLYTGAKHAYNLFIEQLFTSPPTALLAHCLVGDMLAPIIPARNQHIVQANVVPQALGFITLVATSNWILARVRRRPDAAKHWMHSWYTLLGSRDTSCLTGPMRLNHRAVRLFQLLYGLHLYSLLAAGMMCLLYCAINGHASFLDCSRVDPPLESWLHLLITAFSVFCDTGAGIVSCISILQCMAAFLSEMIIVTLAVQRIVRVVRKIRFRSLTSGSLTVASQMTLIRRLDDWEVLRSGFTRPSGGRRADLSLMLCAVTHISFLFLIGWLYAALYERDSILLRLIAWFIIGWSLIFFAVCMIAGAARFESSARRLGAALHPPGGW